MATAAVSLEAMIRESFNCPEYRLLKESPNLNGRKVVKYVINIQETTREINLANAAKVLLDFLEQHQTFCATFETEPLDQLKRKIQNSRFLTINGRAVCFSKTRGESRKPEYADKYFSEDLLEEPICCEKGHYLEKAQVIFWREKNESRCPGSIDPRIGPHAITSLEIDQELVYNIRGYKELLAQEEGRQAAITRQMDEVRHQNEQLASTVENLATQVGEQSGRIQQQSSQLAKIKCKMHNVERGKYLGLGGKLVVKIAEEEIEKKVAIEVGKAALEESGKIVVKQAGQSILVNVVKYTPFISLALGIGLCAYRLWKGEKLAAAGELASGAVATFLPGWGIAVSIGVDASIMIIDVRNAESQEAPQAAVNVPPDIRLNFQEACVSLEIQDIPEDQLTKEQVDRACRKKIQKLHSDQQTHELNQSIILEYIRRATNAKEIIYRHKGW